MPIKVAFFGDFVAQKSVNIRISEEVRDVINSSDLAVCNFEAPIEGDFISFDRVGPHVKQSKDAPALLKSWGFKAVQLANNHMLDYGEEGCKATIDAFGDIVTFGAGSYDDSYKVRVVEVNEKRIGFISCVHHEFGVWDTNQTDQQVGTAWIGHHLIQKHILEAKYNVDYLIVLPHAGVEETDAPIPEWRELYRTFIDWGADAVIGTHPHVPQGWEIYKNKPIFYSLGNFYFDALDSTHPYWKRSIAVELIFRGDDISYKVDSICFDSNGIFIDNNKDRLLYHQYLCDLLTESKYLDYCNQMALNLWREYQNWLVRGLGAFSFRLGFIPSIKTCLYSLLKKRPSTLLVNTMQCESHRWTIIRAQRNVKD